MSKTICVFCFCFPLSKEQERENLSISLIIRTAYMITFLSSQLSTQGLEAYLLLHMLW